MWAKDGPEARALRVDALGLRTQTLNVVRHFHAGRTRNPDAGATMTAADLMRYAQGDMYQFPGIGKGVLAEVVLRLRAAGFAFPGEHEPGSEAERIYAVNHSEGGIEAPRKKTDAERLALYHELVDEAAASGTDQRVFMNRFQALWRRRVLGR